MSQLFLTFCMINILSFILSPDRIVTTSSSPDRIVTTSSPSKTFACLILNMENTEFPPTVTTIQSYPYVASKERSFAIKDNLSKIKTGLSKKTVLEILGEPDKINAVMSPRNWNLRAGCHFSYIVKQRSQNDRDLKGFFIYFDLDDCVSSFHSTL